MKKLNSYRFYNHIQQSTPFEPKVKDMEIFGERFLYDCNSMDLWSAGKDEKIEMQGSEEIPYWEQRMQDMQEKHICFQATYACNLKCRYCFVENHYLDHKNTLTEQEHYEAFKRFQPSGNYRFGWFGGEPLLNWEVIYKVTESVWRDCQQRKLPFPKPHITTNATLMTEEIAKYCALHDFTWIVSLDGPEEIHNGNRPRWDGAGSYEETIRGLRYLADAYRSAGKFNPITLRATFDTINPKIFESVKFLNKLMYDGLASHVSVEPSCLGEGCGIGTDAAIEKLKIEEIRALFWSQYEETARWFVQEIKEGRKPSFHHFEMPMQRLIDRDYAISECGAGMGYISVGPGGKICACHREHRTEMGSMQQGIDRTLQAKWWDNRWYTRDTCRTCWRRAICGGGCRCNSLLVLNRINQPSSVECCFHDMQIKAAIWIIGQLTPQELRRYSKSGPAWKEISYPWMAQEMQAFELQKEINRTQQEIAKLQQIHQMQQQVTQMQQVNDMRGMMQAGPRTRTCDNPHCKDCNPTKK